MIGLVDDDGNIEMRYHQINDKGEFLIGICYSKPEKLTNGKVRLHKSWEWTSGDKSKGQSSPGSYTQLQILVIKSTSVPGRQFVNFPTAAIPDR